MDSDETSGILLIRAHRVVTPDTMLIDVDLTIVDGKIGSISPMSKSLPANARKVIDLDGTTWFPGFIDVHIHGGVSVDLNSATGDDLRRLSAFLAQNGVTGWMPTVVPAPRDQYKNVSQAVQKFIVEQCEALEDDGKRHLSTGARVLGMHYEGPFVNEQQCGALHTEYFERFSAAGQIDSLPVPESALARLITVAQEVEAGLDLIRELARRRWIVSIGHTRADVATLDRAYQAGARHMTHFMNAMAPLHHRAPGPIAWGLWREDVSCDFIADGVHLDPFILRLLVNLKKNQRLVLISDAIAATGMGDGQYEIWGETITVKNGRTNNPRGSIAGSVITMLDAVKMMVSLGVLEVEVGRMAATNPARLLGLGTECGSIQEGKRADLVALDQEGNVAMTIVGGIVAYRR